MTFVIWGRSRFHTHHGTNIQLEEDRMVATRTTSFANGLTFSAMPLNPDQIFVVEIEENEAGWSGHMRIGLTQMNPNTEFELPLYALPDLVSMGPAWLYAVAKPPNSVFEASVLASKEDEPHEDFEELENSSYPPGAIAIEQNLVNYERFPRLVHRNRKSENRENSLISRSHRKKLMPNISKTTEKSEMSLLPTDVGSRIGVMFHPTSSNKADMHFIINGEDQGPCSSDIPYKDAPLYAVVDVYGSTKKVRLVQMDKVDSLQELCRDTILTSMNLSGVSKLPLPKLLKDFLLYN